MLLAKRPPGYFVCLGGVCLTLALIGAFSIILPLSSYKFANLFIVQWREMLKMYPKAVYGGSIYK